MAKIFQNCNALGPRYWGVLNLIALVAMIGADAIAWKSGVLPRIAFPMELLDPEKRTLLVILYTTAVEQQLG